MNIILTTNNYFEISSWNGNFLKWKYWPNRIYHMVQSSKVWQGNEQCIDYSVIGWKVDVEVSKQIITASSYFKKLKLFQFITLLLPFSCFKFFLQTCHHSSLFLRSFKQLEQHNYIEIWIKLMDNSSVVRIMNNIIERI